MGYPGSKSSRTAEASRAVSLAAGVVLVLTISVWAQSVPMAAGEREDLLVQLGSGTLDARGAAARRIAQLVAMDEIASDDLEVLEGLRTLLLAGRGDASHWAMWALRRMGMPAVPAGVAAIQSDSAVAVSYGMQLLHNLARDHPDRLQDFSRAIELLGEYVRGEESRRRSQAIGALTAMGEPALPHLLWTLDHVPDDAEDELDSPRPDLRYQTMRAMARAVSAVGEPAVSPLVQRLSSSDAHMRSAVAYALGVIGEPAADAVAPLIERLSDEDTDVQLWAAYALGRIGAAAKPGIPRLIELARESPTEMTFVRSLREIRPELAHLEDLIQLMSVVTEEAQDLELCRAIAAIGPEATPMLSEALADERVSIRKGAALALRALGPDAEEAVPALIMALEDEALETRVAQALGAIGPGAVDAAPALARRLAYGQWPIMRAVNDDRYDCWSAMALGRIGPGAIPVILEALETDNGDQIAGCFVALRGMGPAAKDTAQVIIEAMEGIDVPRINGIGVEALLAIEADRDMVLAVVRSLAEDPRYRYKRPIHYALEQLQSQEE